MARVILLVSLTMLRAVKITPKLVVRFAFLPFRKVRNPCLYCPGICIASCPTYLSSGNILLSPIGYARFHDIAREKCLKCWRCVQECPLGYNLPETYSKPVKISLRIVRPGRLILVADEEIDLQLAEHLSESLGTGLAVVKGVAERYNNGSPIEYKTLKKAKRVLSGAELAVACSPEVSHALGINFLGIHLKDLGIKLNYEGPIHIPCLLKSQREKLLKSLEDAGVRPTFVDEEECIKLSIKENYLYLCPIAKKHGVRTIFDLISY